MPHAVVDVDALHEGVHVDPPHDAVHVDALDDLVDVDELDDPSDDLLGDRLGEPLQRPAARTHVVAGGRGHGAIMASARRSMAVGRAAGPAHNYPAPVVACSCCVASRCDAERWTGRDDVHLPAFHHYSLGADHAHVVDTTVTAPRVECVHVPVVRSRDGRDRPGGPGTPDAS